MTYLIRQQVYKRLRLIIDDTKALQFIIELGAAGYERCTSSTDLSDFDAFRKTQRMYRNPDPRVVRKSLNPGEHPFSRNWSLNFAKKSVVGDKFLFSLEDRRKFCIYSLRSDVADDDRAWIVAFPFTIDDFGVDRSQDLLVVSSGRSLRFLTLYDGHLHSKAANLENGAISFPDDLAFTSCDILLYDAWLLVIFDHRGHRNKTLFLYHWPSGTLRKVNALF